MQKQRVAIVAVLLLLLGGGAWLGAQHWAEGVVAARVRARLADSEFSVHWASLRLGPSGTVTLGDVVLHDGSTRVDLAMAAEVAVDVALLPSLFARPRLDSLRLSDVQLRVDVVDGKVEALERLRAVLKRRSAGQDPAVPESLLRRLGRVELDGLQLLLQVTRADAPPLQTRINVSGALDPDEASSTLEVQLDATLGGAAVAVVVEHQTGELQAVRADAAEGVGVAAQLLVARLPPDWRLAVRSAALERQVRGWQLVLGDLSLGGVGAAVVRCAEARLGEDHAIAARNLALALGPALQEALVPTEALRALRDVGLAGEWTATVAALSLVPTQGGGLQLEVTGGAAGVAGLEARLQRLTAAVRDRHALRDPASWQAITVDTPSLSLPLDAPLLRTDEALHAQLQHLAGLRKPLPDDDEDDDGNEAALPDAVPDLPPEDDPRRPPPPGQRPKEKPYVRWSKSLNALQDRLLALHDQLDKLWPQTPLPDGLTLLLTQGALQLTDRDGKALLGVRRGRAELLPPENGARRLSFGAEPFDAAGSWGEIGATWQREATGHRLEVRLSGAGIAQLLALKARGLTVERQADIALLATLRLPDRDHLEMAGQLFVDHMGIHWWRLAQHPISDLRLQMPFELRVRRHPSTLTFRSPELLFGGSADPAEAHLSVALDLIGMDAKPRVHLAVEAPPQESAEMLHAIPPQLLPTVGRIDARGPLAWRVALNVPLAMPGASQVELALNDQACEMLRFGDIDLEELNGEFDRPVNENGTILDDVHIGPGSGSWTPLEEIPPHVAYSMWATEDSFFRHRGISELLVAKALSIDLSYGRFIYGGSTVTQQLVKNLYLLRNKALSRKFEEMLIAWQMERVVGKQRILEIYVNGVEFGPKIYGITRAAWAFFGKTPAQLRPKEGVYLAIIKPSPRSGYGTARANGWGEWYEMKTTKYMDRLLDDDFITPEEYEAEKPFRPHFDVQTGRGK